MDSLELKEAIEQLGGCRVGSESPPATRIAGFDTDSRTLGGPSLFVALRGDTHDGHAHVADARRRGAVASVVSRSRLPELPCHGGPYIAVDDPLAALERIAVWNRQRAGLAVVGVTGSVGKTSTKDFLSAVLGGSFRVQAAPKSFNNRLGVALTLLAAKADTEILVVELATSGPGELAHLSRIARPDRVILTEIGAAHLAGLGDLDGVVEAKAEVFEGLGCGGRAFIRRGVYGFDRLVERLEEPPVTFGWREDAATAGGTRDAGDPDYAVTSCVRVHLAADPVGKGNSGNYGYHFTVNGSENFLLPVPGRHNVMNALATIAVARHLGMSWETIRASLIDCRLPPQRGQILVEGGVVLFDDSYNANPRSMVAAIREWSSMEGGRESLAAGQTSGGGGGTMRIESSPLVAVLGDMLELGPDSPRLHRDVGKSLVPSCARVVVTVGEESRRIQEGYRQYGGRASTMHFASVTDALPYLRGILREGDRVLFKASRRIRLDRAVGALQEMLRGGKA